MKNIDRIDLLETIGKELQLRMTYKDIDLYFSSFGIDCSRSPSVNSKRIYVKELLQDQPEEIILKIAEELSIEIPGTTSMPVTESKYWSPNHFRVFVSHLAKDKSKAAKLRQGLKKYGISCFVAHDDIKPTHEWLQEIERSLISMDAMIAILTLNFHESEWTDQEIGAAVGRQLLVIPIMMGKTPYGFIGKYQGLQVVDDQTTDSVCEKVFSAIVDRHPGAKNKYLSCLVTLLLQSQNEKELLEYILILRRIDAIPRKHLERLKQNAPDNNLLMTKGLIALNLLMNENQFDAVVPRPKETEFNIEDLPF